MVTPYTSSRPIPKWIWSLQDFATPRPEMGPSWYLPKTTESAYRVYGSFAAWAAAEVKVNAKNAESDRNFQEARVLGRVLDAIVSGDSALAGEISVRRLFGLSQYATTGSTSWLAVTSPAAADLPLPLSEFRVSKLEREAEAKKQREWRGGQGSAASAAAGAGRGGRFAAAADAGKSTAQTLSSKSAPAKGGRGTT